MRTYIRVNRHHMSSSPNAPCIDIYTDSEGVRRREFSTSSSILINGPCRIVHRPGQAPTGLKGAAVWIETDAEVVVEDDEE